MPVSSLIRSATRIRSVASDHTSIDSGTSKMLWTRNGTVHYRCIGRGDSILIVPGLWGGSRLLEPFVDRLAKTYQVHLFDWPGEGRSLRMETHRSEFRPAEILRSVVDSITSDDLTIFGHCFGSSVALQAFGTGHIDVSRLILSASMAWAPNHSAAYLLKRAAAFGRMTSDNPFLASVVRLSTSAISSSIALERHLTQCLATTDASSLKSRLEWLENFDFSEHLRESSVPSIALLAGDRDVLAPIHCQNRLAEEASDAALFTVPGAGHLGELTHTDAYFAAISRIMSLPRNSSVSY